jgi:hypothetical protein
MLRVKLDAATNELERRNIQFLHIKILLYSFLVKQTLIQSGIDNANQLNVNGQKAIEELDKIKQVNPPLCQVFFGIIYSLGSCTKIN